MFGSLGRRWRPRSLKLALGTVGALAVCGAALAQAGSATPRARPSYVATSEAAAKHLGTTLTPIKHVSP